MDISVEINFGKACFMYSSLYRFTSRCLIMVPNNVNSSAPVLMSLLAGDRLTTLDGN
jgi:hypothetical protein